MGSLTFGGRRTDGDGPRPPLVEDRTFKRWVLPALVLLAWTALLSRAVSAVPSEAWVTRWNLSDRGTVLRVHGMKADAQGNLTVAGDWVESNGPRADLVFVGDDLRDATAFFAKLRAPANAIAQFLQDQLAPWARVQVMNWPPGQPVGGYAGSLLVTDIMASDLNRICEGASIWDPARFAGVKLGEDTQALLTNGHGDIDRIRVNRLLLKDAFPQELWRSRNTAYFLLRFAPTGQLLWATNYASLDYPPNQLHAFDVDRQGNVVMTGTPDTVRFRADGRLGWMYGEGGADVAIDTRGYAFVTGGSTERIRTIELAPGGTNVWTREEADIPQDNPAYPQYPSYSTKVAVNDHGEIFVGGFEAFDAYIRNGFAPIFQLAIEKYTPAGDRAWKYTYMGAGLGIGVRVRNLYSLTARPDGGVIVTGDYYAYNERASSMIALNAAGQRVAPQEDLFQVATDISVVDPDGSVYGSSAFGILRVGKNGPDGIPRWTQDFTDDDHGTTGGFPRGMALDGRGAVIVTGGLSRPESGVDAATLAFSTENGGLLWVRRYNGPANKDDEGRAVVADAQGNLFVAGVSQNEVGGTDVILIKYGAVTPVRRTGSDIRLEFPGPIGGSVDIETSADLADWTFLGSTVFDTNGIARFVDTNSVPRLPQRFYRQKP